MIALDGTVEFLISFADDEHLMGQRHTEWIGVAPFLGACSSNEPEELTKAGRLRAFYTSEYYPSSGIAATPGLDPEVVSEIRQALLDFDPLGEHAEGLYNWERTEMPQGFVAASAQDYLDLETWALRLGVLQASEVEER